MHDTDPMAAAHAHNAELHELADVQQWNRALRSQRRSAHRAGSSPDVLTAVRRWVLPTRPGRRPSTSRAAR